MHAYILALSVFSAH